MMICGRGRVGLRWASTFLYFHRSRGFECFGRVAGEVRQDDGCGHG
jgi:hypothetical protein